VEPITTEERPTAGRYEIRIRGHLANRWADWFEGLTLTREANGETRLTGRVEDQAALHGLLRKVRDLGLTLVAVIQLDPDQVDDPGADGNPDATPLKQGPNS
jgi:hypothetical protein